MTILTLFALAAAQPQSDQPPASAPLDAAAVAAAIQPRLPQRFSPEVALTGAVAEGEVLVLRYTLGDAALAAATPEALSLRFVTAFCAAPGGIELLAGPMGFRADAASPNGATKQGVVIETCPLAPLPPPR